MAILFFILFAVSFVVNFYFASVIEDLQKDIEWWESTAEKEGWY